MPKKAMGNNDTARLLKRWRGTSDFSRKALSATFDELADVMAMQSKLTQEVALYVKHIGDDLGETPASRHLRKIVAATQAEDIIHQKQEHILSALRAVEGSLAALSLETDADGDTALSEALANGLLAEQTLERVKERYAMALLGKPPKDHKDDAEEGDIELF